MAFLIRKFERAKWNNSIDAYKNSGNDIHVIEGDTFSKCLFTTHNTLSVWYSHTDKWDEMEDILATVFSSSDGPSRTDIIILKIEDLNDIEITEEIGTAPVNDETNKLHRNLSRINYKSMGSIAELIANIIINDDDVSIRVKRYSEKQVEKIVLSACKNGVVDVDKARIKERWAKRLANIN